MTTRVPAGAAAAAASQSRTSVARKPLPAGADSVTGRSPVSPYQPMAEAHSSTGGGSGAAAMASTMARVLAIRLSRSCCLRAAVQRPPATDAPDRCTTPAAPLSTAGSSRPAVARGSQLTSAGDAGDRRTSRVTSMPSRSRLAARAVPISPVAPLMTMRTTIPPCIPASPAAPGRA